MIPEHDESVKSRGGVLGACIPFTKNLKTSKEPFGNSRFYIVLSKLIIITSWLVSAYDFYLWFVKDR